MNLTVTGIVLEARLSGESDRVCTILTDSRGVIHAVARGARNMKNKKVALAALFAYGQFVLFRKKDIYVIDEFSQEMMFMGLREDLFRLTVAQYLCQLALELLPDEQPAEEFLPLLRAALWYLSENTRPPLLVKAAAEMRMMSLAGYMPDLVMCTSCGAYEHDAMYFSPAKGCLRCGSCGAGEKSFSQCLGRGAMTALRHTVYADAKKLFAFSLGGESLKQLSAATEAYVKTKLEKNLTTLAFLRTLM